MNASTSLRQQAAQYSPARERGVNRTADTLSLRELATEVLRPQMLFIKFNAVRPQQSLVLILKRRLAVVRFLIADVIPHALDL